MADGAVN
ncbi:hypothetical protein YPPY32_2419, partial [Yersinia pestis PY-32]